MKRYRIVLAGLLLMGVSLAGCATTRLAKKEIPDRDALMDYLAEEGIATDHVGFVVQSLLKKRGEEYRLIGSDVLRVYEYDDDEEAEADVARLTLRPLGSVISPQFYHKGKLLVVYFGTRVQVKLALANVLGTRLT